MKSEEKKQIAIRISVSPEKAQQIIDFYRSGKLSEIAGYKILSISLTTETEDDTKKKRVAKTRTKTRTKNKLRIEKAELLYLALREHSHTSKS
jgi:hypothetical protein